MTNQEPQFTRNRVDVLQVNVGKVCNMQCNHCHVEAGPYRTESMNAEICEYVIALMDKLSISTLDITGGAPELNPYFRTLVEEASRRKLNIIDRCNLTVLLIKSQSDLIDFLAKYKVRIVASLPCYSRDNVDKQRGKGAFQKSIQAIRMLNEAGYGSHNELILDFVHNPAGLHLAPDQKNLESQYKQHLYEDFGIRFNSLIALHNFPVGRFAKQLKESGEINTYMNLLKQNYNHKTLEHLMCRSQISIGYDGVIYDCDFHQMENIPVLDTDQNPLTVQTVESTQQLNKTVPWKAHCYACTAGNGASCSGSLTN